MYMLYWEKKRSFFLSSCVEFFVFHVNTEQWTFSRISSGLWQKSRDQIRICKSEYGTGSWSMQVQIQRFRIRNTPEKITYYFPSCLQTCLWFNETMLFPSGVIFQYTDPWSASCDTDLNPEKLSWRQGQTEGIWKQDYAQRGSKIGCHNTW